MGAERAKIGLVLVLFGVAGFFAYRYYTRPGPISNKISLLCVATGQTFWMSRERVDEIPLANPRTGEKTLIPCIIKEDSTVEIREHYHGAIELVADKNKWVDPQSFAVRPPPGG